jgi:hypothetical protein
MRNKRKLKELKYSNNTITDLPKIISNFTLAYQVNIRKKSG